MFSVNLVHFMFLTESIKLMLPVNYVYHHLHHYYLIEFKHEIENARLNHKLDHEIFADPNINYEILVKVLQSAKVKYIP